MSRTGRSDALDGLRALAALSVVAFHVWLYRPDRQPGHRGELADRLFFELHLGLICFFVLSGFLLYRGFARAASGGGGGEGPRERGGGGGAARRAVDIRAYAARRIARIVPAYYVSIVLCLGLYAAAGYTAIVPPADQLPLFAAFAQNYSWDAIMGINPVAWTLCVEAAFYVALPLVGLLALRHARTPARHAALLGSLVALTLVWNWLARRHGWSDIAEKSLPAYAGHFALGMLAALWVERRPARPAVRLGAAGTAALAATGLAVVAASGWWHETPSLAPDARAVLLKLPAALGFALIVAAIAAGRGPAVAWLRARPLAWTGVVSYGIYLWHLPLILLGNHLNLLPQGIPARLALVIPAAIAAGWASWTLVERPAMSWARGHDRASRARRGRPAAAAAAAGLLIATAAAAPAAAEAPPDWRPDTRAARAYIAHRGGQVSFSVRTERASWSHHGGRTVHAASVVKAMLLVAYLRRPDVRGRPLRRAELRMLAPMIRRSDNAAASRTWAAVGDARLRRLARRAGMRRFTPGGSHWGSARVCARDQARLFVRIDRLVPRRHRATAMRLLRTVVPAQRWGVARAAPRAWRVYFKGGWGSGTGAVDHQAALLERGGYRVAAAVMTTGSGSHAYAKATLRGVFRRLLRGLSRVQ